MRVRRAVKKEAQRRRTRHVRAEQHTEQEGIHKSYDSHTYSKAPIIRTGHSAVLAVHIFTAELAYVPVRIIGTLE